jgi:hypothetical protein
LMGSVHLRSKWTPVRSVHFARMALIYGDVQTAIGVRLRLWVELRKQRSGSKSQKPFASATQVGVLIGGWLEGLWIYALTQGHVISEVPQSRVRIQVSYWIFVRIEPSQQLLNTRFSKTLQDSDALMHRGFEGTVGI